METTLSISPPTPTTDLRRLHHLPLRRNVQYKSQFLMPLIDLTLRLIPSANQFQLRFNRHPNPLSLNSHIISSICTKIMADEPKKIDIQPGNAESMKLSDVGKSKEEEGSGKTTAKPCTPPPPPPEKPLPGDCCGSGCVRCVWDVYYEELDEYDRLYKAN